MRKISLVLFVLAAFLGANAQQTKPSSHDGHDHGTTSPVVTPAAEDPLVLKESEHDFSTIPQGKPVYYNFEISNTGKTPLVLDDVHASCGCTTPEWSRDPIAPGGTARIRVGYNAATAGIFEKLITVTYNTSQSKQIKIKGEVWKVPEGSAPANASVNFLKKQTF